jgi:DNA-binding response OmpR family regulator
VAAPRERIVILDDEEDFRAMIAEYLGGHGYAVRTVATGSALDACLSAETADLILLDLNLPSENGLSIARRLKASGTIPIVFLTAASEAIDRVVGLEVGADDYLVKPCDLREVQARIRAILRRSYPAATPFPAGDGGSRKRRFVPFGKVTLDLDGRCLVTPDGNTRHLTATEFNLLDAFARYPNRVLSRDRLLELGGDSNDSYDRSIDSRIKRIRKKIEINPAKPQVIKTLRSRGYIFLSPGAS